MSTTSHDSAAADGLSAKPREDALPLKIDPADVILESQRAPKPLPASERDRRIWTSRTSGLLLSGLAVLVLLAGAWVGGATYGTGLSSSPSGGHRDEVARAADHEATMKRLQQISAEVLALRTLTAKNTSRQAHDQTESSPSAEIDAGLSALSKKIDLLDGKVSDRMTKMSDDLESLKRQVALGRNTPNVAPASTRHKHRVHDAFDPARDPTAPGAPRPLGSR